MPNRFCEHPVALQTRRLDLIPASLEHMVCELETPERLGQLLGACVPDEWPPGEYDSQAMEFFRTRLDMEGPTSVGWYVWYAVRRDSDDRRDELVAGGGFHGPPVSGVVEIGYSVIPFARGRGYATEIIAALVSFAFDSGRVTEIIAETAESNTASVRALLKNGFIKSGFGKEPGLIRYQLRKNENEGRPDT